MANEIHIGDIGTALQVQIWNCDRNIAVDLEDATSLHIMLKKPDGTSLNKTATLVHPGSGLIQYVTASGDLDVTGRWIIQGIVDINGGTFHSSIKNFSVYRNI